MELTKTTATSTGNTPFGALAAMLYEPSKAFAMLEPRRYAWLPLLLVIASSCFLTLWYFNVVDFAWFSEQMNAANKDVAAREQASKFMTKGLILGMSILGTVIGFPLITALVGLYFMVIAKAMSKEFTFGSGFALVAWSSLPNLLILALGAIQMLLASSNQFSASALNALSINQLFFEYPMAHPLTGPLDMLSVTTFWSIALLVIGFQVWAKVSRATALKVVLIPYATVFGLWLAFALSKAA
jgi:hypothetical protein